MTRDCCAVILAFALAWLPLLHAQAPVAPGQTNRVETGAHQWRPLLHRGPGPMEQGLVLYTHGYTLAGATRRVRTCQDQGLPRRVLSRGFAFAASDYSVQGWAVKEAIEETEALRRYFVAKYGAPAETYITGHSMGGHITMAIIERYPEAYQGAMPMCGPLGAAIDFLNTGVFDMLVTFEALFPGTIGSPYEPTNETAKKVQAASRREPERAAPLCAALRPDRRACPRRAGLFHALVGELKQRAGGEPFDNRNRIYMGSATMPRSTGR